MGKRIILASGLLLGLAACGGGAAPGATKSSASVVDPSGNWALVASDSTNNSIKLAALFNQVGQLVTANSITAAGNPNPFNCVPFSATFTNGFVQNVNQFSGTITAQFGALNFSGTLNADGTAFTGTYSGLNVNNCAGIATGGTFTASEVPSTSGSWTGTIQPCSYDSSNGTCTNNGVSSTMSATLVQNDATGGVTGTYAVTNLAGFTTGSVSVDSADQDILSGTIWQFTLRDANTSKSIVNGTLTGRAFHGIVFSGSQAYALSMTH